MPMVAPEFPPDEDRRLGVLRALHLLDSVPSEQYDRFTALARLIIKTPIALISLVDSDRQWFLSKQGLSAVETPRDISFCGHAILDDKIFVIPDATKDPRFADNPLVVGDPSIRLYAGYPLKTREGFRIGTLCVIDRTPRVLNFEEEQALSLLGKMLEMQLRGLQAVQLLNESTIASARLAAIVDSSEDAIISATLDLTVMTWNVGAKRMFGYSEEEVVGRSIDALFPPDRPEEQERVLQSVTSGHSVAGFETQRRRRDGSPIDLSVSVAPLRDSEGTIIGVSMVARDIGVQKKAQDTLRALVEASPNALVLADRNGSISIVNRQLEELFGYKREELFGENVEVLLPAPLRSDHAAKRDAYFVNPINRPMGSGRELHGSHKDGRHFPIEIGLSPVSLADGNFVLASIIDITERKRIESYRKVEFEVSSAIATSHEFGPAIQRVIAAIAGFLNADVGVVWVLGQGESVLRCTDAWSVGPQYANFLEATRLDSFECGRGLPGRVWQSGEAHWISDVTQDPDYRRAGPARAENLRAAFAFPLIVGGKFCGVLEFTLSSITSEPAGLREAFASIGLQVGQFLARRQASEDLIAARDAALAATKAKSDFLANMSHEIRTPMNAVIGMTGLLIDTPLAPAQRDYAETIRNAGEGLLAIINDILDFSKVEAGKLALENVDFDLQAAIFGVIEILGIKALAKNIELGAIVEADVPTWVCGDPGRLKQILINLVSNGIKFTERGGVTIRCGLLDREADTVRLKFVVEDTGIGIAPNVQPQLFRPFTQADASTTRRFGGTGLGLSIAKLLTELMGGEIRVDSTQGRGTHFTFTTTFARSTKPFPAFAPPAQVIGMRIHYVDDNSVNRQLLQQMLTNWKMEAVGADSGLACLQVLKDAARAGKPFPVAILDYQMPAMDGLQLARAIKSDPEISQTRLILLSSASPELLSETDIAAAGIASTTTKPICQSRLLDIIAMVTSSGALPWAVRAEAQRSLANREATPRRDFRVLVAEDNVVNQRVAVLQLKRLGYRAEAVANGLEALKAVDSGRYQLVLMDCDMPEMDGYEATKAIRSRESGSHHTPIVALTANALSGDRAACLAAGMDDYLSKPVRGEDLLKVLLQWDPPLNTVVLKELRHAVGDDEAALGEIFRGFLGDLQGFRQRIRNALLQGDREDLRQAAHSLKGSSATLGATRLADLCAQLEERSRNDLLGDEEALVAIADEEIQMCESAIRGLTMAPVA